MAKAPAEIRSLARNYTDKAIKVLAGVMMQEDAPPAARVTAANSLLDRGWGKPDSTVIIHDKRDATDWTRDELVAFLSNARANREGVSEAPRSPAELN